MDENLPKSIEIEGSTVEDAINKALKLLNATRDEVLIKIVCEEKKGLFGMEGEKPAKIVVSIKEKDKNA
ncbi:MAG: Jag N-terminal domain-containing protein [Candidatus Omnitrophica bacterium]|nr:Jag N-terminal domain-containing protein [Candidatus Omnitrophota bacterium]MBU1995817.1 Jag N-terminal domain-containing protein [Candidatus Omnitrophota bacterium]MBU4334847.1 Jag N-terminal domain-containing protein [Candidatus Omnitrophota bacterium]